MFITRTFSLLKIWRFSGHHIIWLTAWMSIVVGVYQFFDFSWSIPWLPISLIGTAVAFYVGFKNNSAYGRMWEARKIWGAIVNSSRAWGAGIKAFVSNHFTDKDYTKEELSEIVQRLIYRHIAWLYTLRGQLLVPTPWEHSSQDNHIGRLASEYRDKYGIGLVADEITRMELKLFLPDEEHDRLIGYKNTATQIIDQQAQDLKELRGVNLINDYQHVALQQILYDFYVHQGKCERIKKFPLPRQYANMSRIFIGIFIALLPVGMVGEFAKIDPTWGIWLTVPFGVLVGWVYVIMELVGDYSENPFQGMGNDIPMLSLCRVIEIDLREMLGETDLPPAIEAKNGVLM